MARTAAHNQKIAQSMAARHQHARDLADECASLRAANERLRAENLELTNELRVARTEVSAVRSAMRGAR